MCRLSPVLVTCSCVVAVYAVFALAAPRSVRAAGLDFWNAPRDAATLHDLLDERDEIEARGEANRHLRESNKDVVARLSDGRLGHEEAITALLALWDANPSWKERYRSNCVEARQLPPAATDREAAAHYLSTERDAVPQSARARAEGERKRATAQHLEHLETE